MSSVALLGVQKVVDRAPDRSGHALIGENPVATDEHQPTERRDPHRALGGRRLLSPATVGVLDVGKRAEVVTEVGNHPGMQQHAQRVGHELELLGSGSEAPAGLLADEVPELVPGDLLDLRNTFGIVRCRPCPPRSVPATRCRHAT